MAYDPKKWSLTTPITPEALNHIEKGISDIDDNLYFKPGETFSLKNAIVVPGFLTSSSTAITASIFLPKSLKNVNNVQVTGLDVTARNVPGGYSLTHETSLSIVSNSYISSDNAITIDLTKSEGISGTNNTPIVLVFFTLNLTFN